jgi:exodeoxyribonuclease VII small subunit
MTGKQKESELNFEQALKSLESIVHEMESENLPLDQALTCFEKGVKLSQACQNLLKEAEQKIEIVQNSLDNLKKTSE